MTRRKVYAGQKVRASPGEKVRPGSKLDVTFIHNRRTGRLTLFQEGLVAKIKLSLTNARRNNAFKSNMNDVKRFTESLWTTFIDQQDTCTSYLNIHSYNERNSNDLGHWGQQYGPQREARKLLEMIARSYFANLNEHFNDVNLKLWHDYRARLRVIKAKFSLEWPEILTGSQSLASA